jgi:hypothetical protein
VVWLKFRQAARVEPLRGRFDGASDIQLDSHSLFFVRQGSGLSSVPLNTLDAKKAGKCREKARNKAGTTRDEDGEHSPRPVPADPAAAS